MLPLKHSVYEEVGGLATGAGWVHDSGRTPRIRMAAIARALAQTIRNASVIVPISKPSLATAAKLRNPVTKSIADAASSPWVNSESARPVRDKIPHTESASAGPKQSRARLGGAASTIGRGARTRIHSFANCDPKSDESQNYRAERAITHSRYVPNPKSSENRILLPRNTYPCIEPNHPNLMGKSFYIYR